MQMWHTSERRTEIDLISDWREISIIVESQPFFSPGLLFGSTELDAADKQGTVNLRQLINFVRHFRL